MADDQAALAPAVFSPTGQMQGNFTSQQGVVPNSSPLAPPGLEDVQQQAQADQARERQALAGPMGQLRRAESQRPQVPQLQQQKEPPPDYRDFQKNSLEFASAMAVLGAISTRCTRQPGGAALGAFGAAVNGWQSGNLAQYEAATKEWQEKTKQTILNNHTVLEQYKLALENNQHNIDEQMSAIQLIATQYHDPIMYDAAAAKNFTMVGKIYEAGVKNTGKLELSTEQLNKTLENEKAQKRLTYERIASGDLDPNGVNPKTGQPWTADQQLKLKHIKEQGDLGAYNEGKKGTGGANSAEQQANAKAIGDAIIAGEQSPVMTGLYRMQPAVRSYLASQGFDLAKAQLEYKAAEKQIQSLNGPQMTRYSGLANSVVNTIDEVKSLADQMKNSGVPFLNKAKLDAYIQTQGNTPNGQLAAKYVSAVNTLKEEFANLANGGYAPTEPAWKLANEQINANYGVKELNASLDEVQRLINFRLHAIPNFQTLGPGGENRYTGSHGTPPAATTQTGGTETKTINGKTYFKQDGQWFEQ